MSEENRLVETVTLSQAKALVKVLAKDQSLLLLSPPGVGKSDIVRQAAADAGLECRSLLGTQIAPEDVSGIPRIVGERSVFCPPRVLLPEDSRPFCLFLDELPACAPDIQKAFYSLLLERRLGEHPLPPGTWVVSAGNRVEDRALVRALSSALVNRVILLHVRVDVHEWLTWALSNGVRQDICTFIDINRDALISSVPTTPTPFSTPRAWASLSASLDLAEQAGLLTNEIRRALALGRVSDADARKFCEYCETPPDNSRTDYTPQAEFRRRILAVVDDAKFEQRIVGNCPDDLQDDVRYEILAARMLRDLEAPQEVYLEAKIDLIKLHRLISHCGLAEAKRAIESAMALDADGRAARAAAYEAV